jgi:hypothetical protein
LNTAHETSNGEVDDHGKIIKVQKSDEGFSWSALCNNRKISIVQTDLANQSIPPANPEEMYLLSKTQVI